jgi:hypothetical protein
VTAPLTVYRDRESGDWYWTCRVPMCGRNDWAQGGHEATVRAARKHLARHTRFGFR